MEIAALQKLTLLDYPGKVACIIFTSGCNLRCPYCHNAELLKNKKTSVDIFSFLEKRKNILDGVCITGGEPLLQEDVIDFLKVIKSKELKIKLDTNGFFPNKLKFLVEQKIVDYVAMDIKNVFSKYEETTGIKNLNCDPVFESIDFLKKNFVEHEFRTTVVKNFHTKEDIESIAKEISGSVYYLQRFEKTENVPDKTLESPTIDEMITFCGISSSYTKTFIR